MSFTEFFGFNFWTEKQLTGEIPNIFPLGMTQIDFIRIDVLNIYAKILTDTMERTHGLPEDLESILWDNCLQSEASYGLITLLSRAMTDKSELFLVFDKTVKVLRKATGPETEQIRTDYLKMAESPVGVYISFGKYLRSDMVKLYSALEYCTVDALNKSMNLSKAIQLKMSDLRGSVGAIDAAEVKSQAQLIAKALGQGRDILVDAKDVIENAVPDLTAVKAAMEFLNEKRSFYLGMPSSYICGELNSGLGDSGQADAKATERGLKNYYFSIIKPVLESLFPDIDLEYKSQDLAQITSSMDALKTLSLVDNELISLENKTLIINRLFDLPEDAKGDPPDPTPVIPIMPQIPPAQPNPQLPPGNKA